MNARGVSLGMLTSLSCVFSLVSCDEKRDAVSAVAGEGRRADSVVASRAASVPGSPAAVPGSPAAASGSPSAVLGHAGAAAKGPRVFCTDVPAAKGAKLPPTKLVQLAAQSRPLAPAKPTPPAKHWIWVNLWAAWCGPCREEIPRLKRWEHELASGATPIALAFVSLDDDQRQAQKFLDAQSSNGLRRSFWLGDDERARTAWLATFGVKDAPNLPVQLLFNPEGQLACVVGGAVDDGDFEAVKKFLGAQVP